MNPDRDSPFSIQEFGDLVASALDIQSIPDNTLDFSFGEGSYPTPRQSPDYTSFSRLWSRRKLRKHQARRIYTDGRELQAADVPVPQLPAFKNDILRFASFSLPALPNSQGEQNSELIHPLDAKVANSQPCFILTQKDRKRPPTPKVAPVTESSGSELKYHFRPSTPLSAPGSFLKLKPLTKARSTKKDSRHLDADTLESPRFRSDCYIHNNAPLLSFSNDSPVSESEGMHSFFDDSGYADTETTSSKMEKKRSLPILRSFFSIRSPAKSKSSVKRIPGREISISPIPIPSPVESRRSVSRMSILLEKSCEAESFHENDLFYTPVQTQQPFKGPDPPEVIEMSEDRTTQASGQVMDKINTRNASSPSSTSELSYNGSTKTPLTSVERDHETATFAGDESPDSVEIHSWRLPNLDTQASNCSTSSSDCLTQVTMDCPPKGSIKKRLGIAPHLHLNVPRLSRGERPRSQDPPIHKTKRAHGTPRLKIQATTGLLTINPMLPIVKLASTSLVSLKSITTVTGANKVISGGDRSPERSSLELERPFTPEEDPFAATPQTPLTPVDPVFCSKSCTKESLKSFLPLGNESEMSSDGLRTPVSAPGSLPSWRFPTGTNKSSPALTHPQTSSGLVSITKENMLLPVPKSEKISKPLSARDIALRRTPSTPSIPQKKTRHMNMILNSSQRIRDQEPRKTSTPSNSRPSSPFPMLFRRSLGRKSGAHAARDSPASSSVSTPTSDSFNLDPLTPTPVCQKQRSNQTSWSTSSSLFLSRKLGGVVREPITVSTQDADALVEACSTHPRRRSKQKGYSPKLNTIRQSAWIPDSNTHETEKSAMTDESTILYNKAGANGTEHAIGTLTSLAQDEGMFLSNKNRDDTFSSTSRYNIAQRSITNDTVRTPPDIRRQDTHSSTIKSEIVKSDNHHSNVRSDNTRVRTGRKDIRHITSNPETRRTEKSDHRNERSGLGRKKISTSLPETRLPTPVSMNHSIGHSNVDSRGRHHRQTDSPRPRSSTSNTSAEVKSHKTAKSIRSDERSAYYTVRSSESRGSVTTYSSANSHRIGSASVTSYDGIVAQSPRRSVSSSVRSHDSRLIIQGEAESTAFLARSTSPEHINSPHPSLR